MVLDTIKSGEALEVKEGVKVPIKGACKLCGYISSQDICKACLLLEGLYFYTFEMLFTYCTVYAKIQSNKTAKNECEKK